MFGMEAALFIPSGAMGNLVAGELTFNWQSLNPLLMSSEWSRMCTLFILQ